MKLKFFMLFLLFFIVGIKADVDNNFSVVLFYKSERLPSYIIDTVRQVRFFNPECSIFLIATSAAYTSSNLYGRGDLNITFVDCAQLKKTASHQRFETISAQCPIATKHQTERFFYIEELMYAYSLQNVFQLECDVMLYADLQELLPVFKAKYSGIGAVFQNDILGSLGFLYFPTADSVAKFTAFIVSEPFGFVSSRFGLIDMHMLGFYRNASDKNDVDHLPVVPKEYTNKYRLKSRIGHKVRYEASYYNNIDKFNSVFDADYLGIYLDAVPLGMWGGQAIYNADHFSYEWRRDEQNRKVPFLVYEEKLYRINTLHIYYKSNIPRFLSK